MKSDKSSNGPEVEFPKKYFFSTEIPIRKIDLSLDLHVSFASVLDLVMEAHLQFFQFLGYSVTDIHGNSIIFANAVILYQGELLFKDRVVIDVSLDNMGEKSFDLYFRLSKDRRRQKVSLVKIRVLFFNYEQRKVIPIPIAFRDKFETGKVPARLSPDVGEGGIIVKAADSYGGEIGFRKLEVWKLSHEFVLRLFNLCDIWKPQIEAKLIEHIRSVASLLPIRIAGAWGARIRSEKIRNILKAKVHLEELRYLLVLISDLGLVDPKKELTDLVEINSHLKKYLNRVRSGEARKIK